MVDLRGAAWRVQRDIVQAAVGLFIQHPVGKQPHQELTDITLSPGRLEQANQQHQRDNPAKRAPDLGDDRSEIHLSTFHNP